MKRMTESDVVNLLKKEQGERTAAQFAKEIGISPQYLSDVFTRRRSPGPAILEYLGLRRNESYIPEKNASA